MADTKTTALTAATSWASGDLLYLVRDPAGTPASRKITLDNVLSKIVCAANAKAIGVTGYSLTGSDATSMIDLAGTWNTSGNPVALKIAMTNTASGATSKFISLLAGAGGATEVFSVAKDGSVMFAGGNSNVNTAGIIDCNGLLTQSIQFFSGGTTIVRQDASDTLALRNGANAQTFNVYNTWTDVNNYERGFVRWSSNQFQIGTAISGTGTARDVVFEITGNQTIYFKTDGTQRLKISSNIACLSPITFETDNTHDIGAVGATRPRSIYVGTSLFLPAASSALQVGTHSAIGAEVITGYITIKDSAGNDRKIAVVS